MLVLGLKRIKSAFYLYMYFNGAAEDLVVHNLWPNEQFACQDIKNFADFNIFLKSLTVLHLASYQVLVLKFRLYM